MNKKRNWLKNPTGKETLIVCTLWFISEVLSLSAATNMFTESPLKHSNILFGSLNLATTMITLVTVINYFRNRKGSATV